MNDIIPNAAPDSTCPTWCTADHTHETIGDRLHTAGAGDSLLESDRVLEVQVVQHDSEPAPRVFVTIDNVDAAQLDLSGAQRFAAMLYAQCALVEP